YRDGMLPRGAPVAANGSKYSNAPGSSTVAPRVETTTLATPLTLGGVTTRIWFAFSTVTLCGAACAAPKRTVVCPAGESERPNPLPVMTTAVPPPGAPRAGVIDVSAGPPGAVGAGSTGRLSGSTAPALAWPPTKPAPQYSARSTMT